MLKQLFVGSAFTFVLATSAFAMTPHAATANTSAENGSHMAVRHRSHRLAMNAFTRGDKEVNALNALESAGYRQFGDLRAQGGNFVATATKGGKSYQVTVTPSGSIGTNNA